MRVTRGQVSDYLEGWVPAYLLGWGVGGGVEGVGDVGFVVELGVWGEIVLEEESACGVDGGEDGVEFAYFEGDEFEYH